MCHIPVMNIEDHDCNGLTIESIRDEVYVASAEMMFQMKVPVAEASIYYFDQTESNFVEFLRYITLSSTCTNGVFKNEIEGNNALLCYESSQFYRFSMFFAIIAAGIEPEFTLRAVTSREHGLMFFQTNNRVRHVQDEMKIPVELLKCTALFSGLEANGNNISIEINQKGMEKHSIQWCRQNGWIIPKELDGNRLSEKVSA